LLWLLAIASFLAMADHQLLIPLLKDIATGLGTGVEAVGRSATAYAFGAALVPLLLGPAVDRGPRRRWFTLGALLFGAATGAIGLTRSVEHLMLARFCAGGAGGILGLAGYALLGDHLPITSRGRGAGAAFIGTFAALLLAIPLGSALGQWAGWRAPYLVIGCGSLLLGLAAPPYLPASLAAAAPVHADPSAAGYRGALRSTGAIALLLATLLAGAGTVGLLTYLGAHLRQGLSLSTAQAGQAYGGAAAAALLCAPLAGRISDHLGPRVTLCGANLIAALAFAVAGLRSGSLTTIVLAVAIGSAGYAARSVSQTTLATSLSAPGARARLLASLAAAAQIGGGLGAWFGGQLFARSGFAVLAVCSAGLAVAAATVVAAALPRRLTP
jgi:predicted MFS family arabinose efflux permease